MSILLVPTDGTGLSSYFQTTTFEGTAYTLSWQFNQRCGEWYLSIADSLGVDIYNGVKVVCGLPLLRKCKDPRRPPGILMCLPNNGDSTPPGAYDLYPGSGRCAVYYVTSDWVALIAQGLPGIAAINAQLTANTQTSATSQYGQE